MKRQPSYRPLEPSAVFANGISARPLVEGTVAREQSGSTVEIIADGEFISRVPMPVTYEMLSRGRERFDIYCATDWTARVSASSCSVDTRSRRHFTQNDRA